MKPEVTEGQAIYGGGLLGLIIFGLAYQPGQTLVYPVFWGLLTWLLGWALTRPHPPARH